MAERVYLHLGVPKSGTTYLQSALRGHRDQLQQDGVLLPGSHVKDHLWGSLAVREDASLFERKPGAWAAWDRVLADVARWPGTAVVSHEFYGAASADQADRAVAALAPAEVHLVVTARDALSVLTAAWQERVKYHDVTALDDFSTTVSADPDDVWNWRNLDAGLVLERWARSVPPEHVHVVCPPGPDAAPVELWRRFAGLFLPAPDAYAVEGLRRNPSMGLVEVEVLREVSRHLADLPIGLPTMTWVRDYLGGAKLAAHPGERFLPGPDRVEECRERSRVMVGHIEAAGYDVVGDLDTLLVPDRLPSLRTPADVRPDEVAACAALLVSEVLGDLRERDAALRRTRNRVATLRRRVRRLERGAGAPGPADAPAAPTAAPAAQVDTVVASSTKGRRPAGGRGRRRVGLRPRAVARGVRRGLRRDGWRRLRPGRARQR